MMKTSIASTLAILLGLGGFLPAQDAVPIREDLGPPAVATTPERSRVVIIERPSLVSRYFAVSDRVADAVNEGILALTGTDSLAKAWSQFVSPGDKVAIKINTQGGPIAGTHPAIVKEVVAGLQSAGISPEQIRVWDKNPDLMVAAGYVPMAPKSEWICEAVINGRGWDPERFYFHEVVGRLIYSDHDFVGAAEPLLSEEEEGALPPGDTRDQISNRSYYARILTGADKVINIAPLSDHPKVGILGAYSSLIIGSIDNHRRFLGTDRTSAQALAEIYAESGLKNKAVLHIIDGLVAQFAGGPEFNPNFASTPGLLMFSQDPVALDTLGVERLEAWRKNKSVPSISDQILHLKAAAAWNFGTSDREEMEIVAISSPGM
jgi:uncharacterized protein (DUF362 family)